MAAIMKLERLGFGIGFIIENFIAVDSLKAGVRA
jgi:hypothetical protein